MPEAVPRTVRFAAAVAVAEGAALCLAAGLLAVLTATGSPDSLARALLAALFALAGGVVLVLLGRALGRAQGWARAPVTVLQLLALPVGYNLAGPSGQPQYGVPVLVLAGVELYLLFTGASAAALDRD